MTHAIKRIPTYPFDHGQFHGAQPRASRALAYRSGAPHLLLGKQSTDTAEGEWRWGITLVRKSSRGWAATVSSPRLSVSRHLEEPG